MPNTTRTPNAISLTSFSRRSSRILSFAHSCSDRSATRFSVPSASDRFWILHGTGNNGKSIFVNLFNNLLGDYASGTTTSSIMLSKGGGIPNDIARLRGKRFIVVPETEENERLNSSLVKALSAGDQMTARFLFGEFFDFYFTGKLWIATNHLPTDH
jgi:putative DNA primase/helicase